MVLALAGIGVAYSIDAAARTASQQAHRLDTSTTLSRSLGDRELEIPLSWFRYEEQRADGFAKQIDLRLELPLGAGSRTAVVDVTLLPRSRARPSASLLDGVYLHQFGAEQVFGPPGLIGKPLRPGEGYTDETVWFDALAASPFVAKCSRPIAGSGSGQCLRTVHLGPGIAAVYAFPEDVLGRWREFDGVLEGPLRAIGAL